MEPTEQLAHILPTLSSTVDRIRVTQLSDPTPCTNFTVHDVLNHMIVGGGTFAYMFRGEQPPEITSPETDSVPAEEFRRTMDDLFASVRSDGALDRTLTEDLRDGDTFKDPTIPPADADLIERLAAFSGRSV